MTVESTAPAVDRRQAMTSRLAEAVEELLAGGADYAGLSVAEIIRAANIARSTFYIYFDDKGSLLAAVGRDVITSVIDATQTWSTLPDTASRSDLRATFATLLETYRQHSGVMTAMADAAAHDETVRREFHRLRHVGQDRLTRHVLDGQRTGVVRPGIHAPTTVAWLISMIERGLYQHARTAGDQSRHVDALTDVVWYTLYADTPGRGPTGRDPYR